ncbi:transmembrane protein 234-like [Amphiura filiformis]|uniref:transmembrane protein 234-like n=1 Tax=Amphiura filiformis TaxID=82378 RepID=UPI003B212B5D
MIWIVFWLVIVAILWGATNPLMKKGGAGIENIHKDSTVKQFLAELQFLICNWKYLVPFVINQSGSIVFYLTLASAELSLAVPITNSLTFLVTTVTGYLMGENIGGKETILGMCLVLAGVTLCVWDKT